MSEWKPIETAPKDGTNILVIDVSAEAPEADIAHYYDGWWVGCPSDTRDGLERAGCDVFGTVGVYTNATHWQHLPEPPQ